MNSTSAPIRRLTNYWKLEAINVVLLPGIAVIIVLGSGGSITIALILSMFASSFLLVIGTISLRMMLRKARGDAHATKDRIPLLIRMQWLAVVLCVAAAAALSIDWVSHDTHLTADRVASGLLLVLAILEYVNYYHVQLQHFDHAADWKRLWSGRGFRQSHLAREISRWKRVQGRSSGQ